MYKPRILIADDEPGILEFARDALKEEPWIIRMATNGREALDLLCKEPFDVAVLDLRMPFLNGLEVLKAVKEKGIQTNVLILTGHGTIETAVEAMKIGARDFITKPFRLKDFKATLRELLEPNYASPRTLPNRLDDYLSAHASNPLLRLEDLCRHFEISSRYISRLFREHLGTTFKKRLTFYRVERAKELLRTTDAPLYQIAEQCGFHDYRQLTRTFRQLEEIAPKAYRNMFRREMVG